MIYNIVHRQKLRASYLNDYPVCVFLGYNSVLGVWKGQRSRDLVVHLIKQAYSYVILNNVQTKYH